MPDSPHQSTVIRSLWQRHSTGDLIDPVSEKPVGNVQSDPEKEIDAGPLDKVIVWTFTGSVPSLILLIYSVVMNDPWIDGHTAGDKREIVYRAVERLTEAAAPAPKEFGTFPATVLASLLSLRLPSPASQQSPPSQNPQPSA
ncbi:MAG: hypothetical protein ABSE46_01975 [Terracidiphilus sp.]